MYGRKVLDWQVHALRRLVANTFWRIDPSPQIEGSPGFPPIRISSRRVCRRRAPPRPTLLDGLPAPGRENPSVRFLYNDLLISVFL